MLFIRPRPGSAPPDPVHAPPGDPSPWLDALDRLSCTLSGLRWLLAGGLSIPLTIGRFYRAHGDLDIVFPFGEIGAVDDAMRAAGYRLTTRVCFDLGPRRIVALLPLRGRGIGVRLRPRKLRFVHRSKNGSAHAPHVDVMPYDEIDGCIAPRNMRRRVPIERPLEGHRVGLPSGAEVRVLDLHYVRALMLRPDTAVHRLDREIIDSALSYRSRTTAAPPLSSAAASRIA